MHTIWVRLNAVVFFGLTVLLGLSCLAAVSKIGHSYMHQPGKWMDAWWPAVVEGIALSIQTYIFHTNPLLFFRIHRNHACAHLLTVIHKLELKTLKSLKSHGGVDRALLSFDIHADMEPAFHWNVKQLFVYVVASYETESKKINQVVIWDKILEAIDPVKEIKQENVFVKYALVDQGDQLRGKDVQLQLMWDHMPITGFVYMGEQAKETMTQFTLPSEYQ